MKQAREGEKCREELCSEESSERLNSHNECSECVSFSDLAAIKRMSSC